jgi:hypothetical protein
MAEVQRLGRNEFGTPPPTFVTVAKLCDKFEEDGTAQDGDKGRSGRTRSAGNDGNGVTGLQAFTQSPRKF